MKTPLEPSSLLPSCRPISSQQFADVPTPKKEQWVTPSLISFATLSSQLEEEELFYHALLTMSEHEFRLLSGSGG